MARGGEAVDASTARAVPGLRYTAEASTHEPCSRTLTRGNHLHVIFPNGPLCLGQGAQHLFNTWARSPAPTTRTTWTRTWSSTPTRCRLVGVHLVGARACGPGGAGAPHPRHVGMHQAEDACAAHRSNQTLGCMWKCLRASTFAIQAREDCCTGSPGQARTGPTCLPQSGEGQSTRPRTHGGGTRSNEAHRPQKPGHGL